MDCAALKMQIGSLFRTHAERDLYALGQKALIEKALREAGTPIRRDMWPDHPLHEQVRWMVEQEIASYSASCGSVRDITISFTDSICAIPGKALSEITIHAGISGSGGLNTLKMAQDVCSTLKFYGLRPKYIVVGCDIGNPLLSRWAYDVAIGYARTVHRGIRGLYPDAKIIRYGLPPTLDGYAESCFWQSENDLAWICAADPNSVFISLDKLGSFGAIARTRFSAEGIHLSDSGVVKLNSLIAHAKEARAYSIVR